MPIHDWTRVTAGTFHHFHGAWITELGRALNNGLLPSGYYSLTEQMAGQVLPDVLTLQEQSGVPDLTSKHEDAGGLAVAVAPPVVALRDSVNEAQILAARQRRLTIRHSTGDRIVALLEIISPGNKEKPSSVAQYVDKAAAALDQGLHLQIIDLFPPRSFDVDGMHGAIWSRLGGSYSSPLDKPLTLASYAAGGVVDCYVEPTAVGSRLIDMPLFLTGDRYVNVPLEQTYRSAYETVPARWRQVIEAST